MKGWVLIGARGGLVGAAESRLPSDVCPCVCARAAQRISHFQTSLLYVCAVCDCNRPFLHSWLTAGSRLCTPRL